MNPIFGSINYKKHKKVKTLTNFYTLKDKNDNTLLFESRFESGNLASVSKISNKEYNLLLQNDINTKGHVQWF